MWLTLAVLVVSVVFLWREARALRADVSSRRQFTLRAVGCAVLLLLALLLQFKDLLLLPHSAKEFTSGERLLRLLQFTLGVFVLVMALVLVALLDVRETLQRYTRERRRLANDLVQISRTPPPDDEQREKTS